MGPLLLKGDFDSMIGDPPFQALKAEPQLFVAPHAPPTPQRYADAISLSMNVRERGLSGFHRLVTIAQHPEAIGLGGRLIVPFDQDHHTSRYAPMVSITANSSGESVNRSHARSSVMCC